MEEKSKLIKVTLEFEDEIRTIEGKEAQEWLDANNANAIFCHVHNANALKKYNWNIIKK